MAEIKSTLDLVMEKTRHLTLSGEERRENRRRELAGRLKGLLQRLEDGLLDPAGAVEEIDALLREEAGDIRPVLCEQLTTRLAPEKENQPWIELLARYCRADAERLEQAIGDVRRQLAAAVTERRRQRLAELAAQGIAGSAVQPNLDSDAALAQQRRALERRFRSRLEEIIPPS